MAIPVTCSCGKVIQVKDEHAGRRIKCQKCKATIDVPGPTVAIPARTWINRIGAPGLGGPKDAVAAGILAALALLVVPAGIWWSRRDDADRAARAAQLQVEADAIQVEQRDREQAELEARRDEAIARVRARHAAELETERARSLEQERRWEATRIAGGFLKELPLRDTNNAEIIDSRKIGDDQYAFQVGIPGDEVMAWTLVVKGGRAPDGLQPYHLFWWLTLEPKELVARYVIVHHNLGRVEVEDVKVEGLGQMTATVRELATGRTWNFSVDTINSFGGVSLVEAK